MSKNSVNQKDAATFSFGKNEPASNYSPSFFLQFGPDPVAKTDTANEGNPIQNQAKTSKKSKKQDQEFGG